MSDLTPTPPGAPDGGATPNLLPTLIEEEMQRSYLDLSLIHI